MFQSSRIIVHSKKINITCEVCNFVARDYEDIECIEKNGLKSITVLRNDKRFKSIENELRFKKILNSNINFSKEFAF